MRLGRGAVGNAQRYPRQATGAGCGACGQRGARWVTRSVIHGKHLGSPQANCPQIHSPEAAAQCDGRSACTVWGMPGGGPEGTGFEPAGGAATQEAAPFGVFGESAVSCEEVGRRCGHDRVCFTVFCVQ